MCRGFGSICGGSGWGAWRVVATSKGSSGSVWADCDVFISVCCFLRLSEVVLCACCIVAWGTGLLDGVGNPCFVGGCFGLGLW